MSRVIPFIKGKSKTDKSAVVLDTGTIYGLTYNIYARGNIHLIDDDGLVFKKDCDMFEDDFTRANLNQIKDEDEIVIKGAGDTSDLVVKCTDGDIQMSLISKEFPIMKSLRDLISKAKKHRGNSV